MKLWSWINSSLVSCLFRFQYENRISFVSWVCQMLYSWNSIMHVLKNQQLLQIHFICEEWNCPLLVTQQLGLKLFVEVCRNLSSIIKTYHLSSKQSQQPVTMQITDQSVMKNSILSFAILSINNAVYIIKKCRIPQKQHL